jgi:hypothetical protein
MAARRLLIVMLVLLGLSTLAAALVPQHSLRDGTTTGTTTTQPTVSTTTPAQPAGRSLGAKLLVGVPHAKKPPVVANPVCAKRIPDCEPLHVGDQLSLKVYSTKAAELEIPAFGLIGSASSNSPAFFQLLLREPDSIGVLFTSSGRVAARIDVLSARAAAKSIRKPNEAKSRARGGSGPA